MCFDMFKIKTLLLLFTIFLLTIVNCVSEKESTGKSLPKYYIDNRLSFFDPYEVIYSDGKYHGYTYETWLRQPENLKTIHETFKKIGYNQLISNDQLMSNPCILWGYVNRPLNQLIDSLVITYPQDTIKTKYYREFWQRRRNENNDEITFEILQELSTILLKHEQVNYRAEYVNDTLYNLVIIERLRQNPTKEQALHDFEYLKTIGMYGSAYNLLFENWSYENVDWNKEELVQELKSDTGKCCPKTWIVDNTK